jgi:protein-tyrosine phosphatase
MSNYNWIDNNVAIGNFYSDYREFDIIINLDYPYNGVNHNDIEINYIDNKIIYKIGCYDSENENMYGLLNIIIPELISYYKVNKDIKILFHCHAGVSRSSTLAIAFLCMSKNYLLRDVYSLVLNKRPIVKPNNGFIIQLREYLLDSYFF